MQLQITFASGRFRSDQFAQISGLIRGGAQAVPASRWRISTGQPARGLLVTGTGGKIK